MEALFSFHRIRSGTATLSAPGSFPETMNFKIIFLFFILIIQAVFINSPSYAATERYYIDDQPVLLYKVINWWYDSLPDQSQQLCGHRIKYTFSTDTASSYNADSRQLAIFLPSSFADLLSIFKTGDHCFGPSRLHCEWINGKYFGQSKALDILPAAGGVNRLVFDNFSEADALSVKNTVGKLSLSLEGAVGGLMNGKIALFTSCESDMLKKCTVSSGVIPEDIRIELRLITVSSKEVLAIYRAIWE